MFVNVLKSLEKFFLPHEKVQSSLNKIPNNRKVYFYRLIITKFLSLTYLKTMLAYNSADSKEIMLGINFFIVKRNYLL